jgi:hypothetical protein
MKMAGVMQKLVVDEKMEMAHQRIEKELMRSSSVSYEKQRQ